MIRGIVSRIYADFFLPSRLAEYRSLLTAAIGNGYEMHSIRSFWALIRAGGVQGDRKYFISRHDIDTDVNVARCMWDIERELNVAASYYFRLSTLDYALMKEIDRHGSEASYHYEEIATAAKKYKYKTKEDVYRNIDSIRLEFADNVTAIRKLSGLPLHIVASHGDFVNRRLGLSNHYILQDKRLRDQLGISLEVYDDAFMSFVTSRHSDTIYPHFYKPSSPLAAIAGGERVIYFLSHPRHWRANPKENFRDNMNRLLEDVKYRLPV